MVLPVDSSRLCPDCDILTESLICPVCGRDRTFPVAAWLSSLKAARPPAVAHAAVRARREVMRGRLGERHVPARAGRLAAPYEDAS
jgi:hypothetical protein